MPKKAKKIEQIWTEEKLDQLKDCLDYEQSTTLGELIGEGFFTIKKGKIIATSKLRRAIHDVVAKLVD